MSSGDEKVLANNLIRQATAEMPFRRRVTEFIASILKGDDIPNSLKLYTIFVLFIIVCLSCDITIFCIDGAVYCWKGTPLLINPIFCLLVIVICIVIALVPAFPLTMRMASFEEAQQLQMRLEEVQRAKPRGRRRQIGSKPADN
jgi:hypothetical protein